MSNSDKWTSSVKTNFNYDIFETKSLADTLYKLFDEEKDDIIIETKVYIKPVDNTKRGFFHKIVIFKTERNYFYSFEKMTDAIYIQRSKKESRVLEFQGQPRSTQLDYSTACKFSLREILEYVYNKERKIEYDLLTDNCIHFAKRIVKTIGGDY